jgi:hypothetical protein
MTLFGITWFEDIELPEFPFPDLGPLGEEESRPGEPGAGRRPTATDPAELRRERPGELRLR